MNPFTLNLPARNDHGKNKERYLNRRRAINVNPKIGIYSAKLQIIFEGSSAIG
jgi:hypothetical protein